jgi:hypothetical protein
MRVGPWRVPRPSLKEWGGIRVIGGKRMNYAEYIVRAVIAFAASSAEEALPLPSVPQIA